MRCKELTRDLKKKSFSDIHNSFINITAQEEEQLFPDLKHIVFVYYFIYSPENTLVVY